MMNPPVINHKTAYFNCKNKTIINANESYQELETLQEEI